MNERAVFTNAHLIDGENAPSNDMLGLEASPAFLSMLAAKNAGVALDHGYTGAVGADFENNRNWFMGLRDTGLSRKADGADGWRFAVRSELGIGADIVKISVSAGHGSMPVRGPVYLTPDELRACVRAQRGECPVAHALCEWNRCNDL